MDWAQAAARLGAGEVGVVPTDTVYGIVGSALKPAVVERIYALRQRELDKPMIVLVSSWEDLERLGLAQAAEKVRELLERVWPGPVSVVLPAEAPELRYLHRGSGGIAVRMPAEPHLRGLLQQAGPVVAPSANLAGDPTATSVAEARAYFGDAVFYLDGGELRNPPSALVDARVDPPRILRPAPGFSLN